MSVQPSSSAIDSAASTNWRAHPLRAPVGTHREGHDAAEAAGALEVGADVEREHAHHLAFRLGHQHPAARIGHPLGQLARDGPGVLFAAELREQPGNRRGVLRAARANPQRRRTRTYSDMFVGCSEQ